MFACECPLCETTINLDGYEENDMVDCPGCGAKLEIISLTPPVLEELLSEEDIWGQN